MFPLRLRRPAAIGALRGASSRSAPACCSPPGAPGRVTPRPSPARRRRCCMGTAAAALHELRARRPDAGCGCFGELSRTPVSWRAIARATLLCVAALATIGIPPLRMPDSAAQAWLTLAAVAAELAVLDRAVTGDRPGHAPAEPRGPVRAARGAGRTDAVRAARERAMAALPALPRHRDADRRLARGVLALRGLPGRAGQPPRWTWSSPSTWPAAAPRSASACWTRARASRRPWRRRGRTRYGYLTAYKKNPIQKNKVNNPERVRLSQSRPRVLTPA